ncbi:hypothetical protein F8G81_17835 [Arthrobacter sp. CDRTa11]|uniref:hypothetical protein n=1 Tax=Arthrobacter sp. CDRTa11 TaxID=2651199 RepID=UPI002265A84E|nr:hypothetical protein [Arthrobacter sp. CDRTa11]UZX04260.1 hypothetical protein F8G81_17835 [Arthrobacter sp. CDRTa11]
MTMLPEDSVLADFTMDLEELGPDLHTEARSVAGRTRQAQDAFEVAVILATLGYGDQRARELGCRNVFELAEKVTSLLPLFGGPADEPPVGTVDQPPEPSPGPDRMSLGLLAKSLLYSAPWIVAVLALVIGRVSFWSTITPQMFSTTVSLALFAALILTGGFMQAFARRGLFYSLQHSEPLLRWALRWTLGGGLAVLLLVMGGSYLILEYVVQAYTPAANRSFLLFGISIGILLLAFSPLYLAKALLEVVIAASAGGLIAVLGGLWITSGDYINLYTAQYVQFAALWTSVLVAVLFDIRVVRRLAAPPAGIEAPSTDNRHVLPPRFGPVARSVRAYWAYGTGFFVLLVVDQLVAGGLWMGTFHYNGLYQVGVGTGLLVLIPTLTYAIAAGYLLPATVRREMRGHLVSGSAEINRVLLKFYRRHLVITLLVGLVSGALLFAAAEWLSTASLLTVHLQLASGVYTGSLVGYLLLGIGAFNAGQLFSLGRATLPAVVVWLAAAVSLATGMALSYQYEPLFGSITGLVTGAAVFAVATTVAAFRMFRQFDLSYFRAF